MPDFNKGDFTQQGIAGDVTSLVRLNEKRTVKLTLSADDASDNCDISGSVIDELNGKTYPIGSGVSGGGDSMFKTTLTIVNNTDHLIQYLPIGMRADYFLLNNNVVNVPITEVGIILNDSNMPEIELQRGQTMTLDLYYCSPLGAAPSSVIKFMSAYAFTVSNAVNFTYNSEVDAYLVTDLSNDSSITVTLTPGLG